MLPADYAFIRRYLTSLPQTDKLNMVLAGQPHHLLNPCSLYQLLMITNIHKTEINNNSGTLHFATILHSCSEGRLA